MGNMPRFKGILEGGGDKFLTRQFIKGLRSPPGSGYFVGHFSSIACFVTKKNPARAITAPRPSACRCFLPDLAELGGGRSHDSWRGKSIVQQSLLNGKGINGFKLS